MLAYYFTHELGIHTKHFGFQEFRVLFVTTSAKRVENMIEVNKRFNEGAGSPLLLFTNVRALRDVTDILKHPWVNGRGEQVSLMD